MSLTPWLALAVTMTWADVEYGRDVRPILAEHCLKCHGPEKQESGLRLDRRDVLLRGGDSGEPAAVPSDSAASYLLARVRESDPETRMPPGGKSLDKQQIEILRQWIDQGLPMPDGGPGQTEPLRHWSFQPVAVQRPAIEDDWIRNPIDAFVYEQLRQRRLTPSPRADRRTLIRRLFLVALGLPPTPEQVQRFVSDPSPQAYERLVESVLGNPDYGPRWARHWLDVARFGETHGFETNRERTMAWPYRDYVVEAWNADLPYDRFVEEQLAGDVADAPRGTGFLVAGPHDLVKSPDINLTRMQRQDELADIVNTTGTAFLGLTLGCARCHNHKFDPITQRDYYSIQAIFAGVQHGQRELPIQAGATASRRQLALRIQTLRRELSRWRPSQAPSEAAEIRPAVSAVLNEETFPPTSARHVRFTVLAANSVNEPCLDELEVFSGDTNVALSAAGAMASASGTLPGYAIHQLEHVHDGKYGNDRSWISDERNGGWVQISLPRTTPIDRIRWSRDRKDRHRDRVPTLYKIEVADTAGQWRIVATSDDRLPFGNRPQRVLPYEIPSDNSAAATTARQQLETLDRLLIEVRQFSNTQLVYAGSFRQPEPTRRLYRGDPSAPREQVPPAAVAALGGKPLPLDAPEQDRRVAMAGWITSPDNPLTARVIANRLWQYNFGTGLVDTSSDFGSNGTPPTHPRLLDWLAAELVRGDWSLKHLQRLILCSATFQQAARVRGDAQRVDAAARYLWRFPTRRLEAEAIRDSLLSVSGVLDRRLGGPGFSGFEVQKENVRHYFPKQKFGPEDWRRMIYMTKVRQEQDAVFGAFDCPDASQVMPRRSASITAIQALNLLNSPFLIEQSRFFAARLTALSPAPREQVRWAFQLAMSRDPAVEEWDDAEQLIGEHGLPAFCRALLNASEFSFIP